MKIDDLYADMMSTMSAQNTRSFEQAFLAALKYVIRDLNKTLRDVIEPPTEISSEDIGFEDYCDNVFHPGVKFYMQRSGQWASEPDPQGWTFYQQQLRNVIASAILEIDDFPTR